MENILSPQPALKNHLSEIRKPVINIMTIKRVREFDKYGSPSSDLEEEALRNLLQHRLHEVKYLKERVVHYTSLLAEAEARVKDAESKLSRFRGHNNGDAKGFETSYQNDSKRCKVISISDDEEDEAESRQIHADHVPRSKKTKISEADCNLTSSVAKPKKSSNTDCKQEVSEFVKDKYESQHIKGSKSETYSDLITKLGISTSPIPIVCHPPVYVPAKHSRKLKSLAFSPSNDDVFATSALDGEIKIWQLESNRSNASITISTNCKTSSNKWPEDIAWHTLGNSIFCAYSAEPGESQVSIINLDRKKKKNRVFFLPEKPHKKGLINTISYMPWDNNCFATGGSDHAVVIWRESGCRPYKPTKLHEKYHSSAVVGAAGLLHKKVILSAGVDKRVIGYNVDVEKVDCRVHLDSKCFAVVPNPCDCNLLLVQTGEIGKQLRLYDYRASNAELVSLGFKQESSESVTALIGQSWSPNGLYLSSGSVDPVIHIFDIRYNSPLPSHSIQAHHKRVFKAAWHQSRHLLVSISSDTNIGLHTI